MKYNEVRGDLFTLPDRFILVHCISSDSRLGMGIAAQFQSIYGVREELFKMKNYDNRTWQGHGFCIITECKNRIIANLVTKEKYFNKPTYTSLKESLIDLRQQLLQIYGNRLLHIGMPKIGCGLDKLKWEIVSDIIKDIFKNTNFTIQVMTI